MTIFTCEDSLEGILCGVYDAWTSRLGHDHVRLELENTGSLWMFADYRQAERTAEKAKKVSDAILRKAGRQVYEQVYRVSLSCEEEKADRIYRFLVYALRFGSRTLEMLQIPAVYEMFRIDRSVSNEAHLLIEFIRFARTGEGVLVGTIGPKNDAAVLLAPHFADRLNGENWIIYDENRKEAVVHRAMGEWIVVWVRDDGWKDRLMASGDQKEFEDLWKTFHGHIAIAERENPLCQRTHLPLRYRPYMTEFQK